MVSHLSYKLSEHYLKSYFYSNHSISSQIPEYALKWNA